MQSNICKITYAKSIKITGSIIMISSKVPMKSLNRKPKHEQTITI
jgi:hypothetical protein